jgi:hypothetical protein
MYEEEVVGSRGKEKKTNILPRMHVSKYWQYASGESKNEKKKIKKRREKEENKKQKKKRPRHPHVPSIRSNHQT